MAKKLLSFVIWMVLTAVDRAGKETTKRYEVGNVINNDLVASKSAIYAALHNSFHPTTIKLYRGGNREPFATIQETSTEWMYEVNFLGETIPGKKSAHADFSRSDILVRASIRSLRDTLGLTDTTRSIGISGIASPLYKASVGALGTIMTRDYDNMIPRDL